MSNEPTQAVQRAAEALAHFELENTDSARPNISRVVLAAALDVEEIAIALFEVDYERGLNDVPWHEEQDWFLERYRKRARALRAAILGEES